MRDRIVPRLVVGGGQTDKEDAMFKTTFTAIALVATVVTTTGCGLSYDYQRNSLLGAGPSSLCYAATDPRIGGRGPRKTSSTRAAFSVTMAWKRSCMPAKQRPSN